MGVPDSCHCQLVPGVGCHLVCCADAATENATVRASMSAARSNPTLLFLALFILLLLCCEGKPHPGEPIDKLSARAEKNFSIGPHERLEHTTGWSSEGLRPGNRRNFGAECLPLVQLALHQNSHLTQNYKL